MVTAINSKCAVQTILAAPSRNNLTYLLTYDRFYRITPVGSRYFPQALLLPSQFPATEHHRPLANAKLYCSKAHVCVRLAQRCYMLMLMWDVSSLEIPISSIKCVYTLRDGQAELTCISTKVTHPRTNRARRRATTLITTNAKYHSAKQNRHLY